MFCCADRFVFRRARRMPWISKLEPATIEAWDRYYKWANDHVQSQIDTPGNF